MHIQKKKNDKTVLNITEGISWFKQTTQAQGASKNDDIKYATTILIEMQIVQLTRGVLGFRLSP